MDRPTRSIMVIPVHTLGGPRLGRMLLDLAAEQPTSFHFVVPTTTPEYGFTWTEAQAERDARRRLAVHLEFSRTLGLDAQGEIAPAEPENVVRRLSAERSFDRLIVSKRRRLVSQYHRSTAHALAELEAERGILVTILRADAPMEVGANFDVGLLRADFLRWVASFGSAGPAAAV